MNNDLSFWIIIYFAIDRLAILQHYLNERWAIKGCYYAVMAIEASAKKAHLSGKEMHDRLKRQGLIHKRLLRHYEQLHTQSLDWVVDDTLETLHNWEQEEKENELEK